MPIVRDIPHAIICHVTCDGCGAELVHRFTKKRGAFLTFREAREAAISQGWSVDAADLLRFTCVSCQVNS